MEKTSTTAEQRVAARAFLTESFGAEVTRVWRYKRKLAWGYSLMVGGRPAEIGTILSIRSYIKVSNSIADATGRILDKKLRSEWDAIAQAILTACEDG